MRALASAGAGFLLAVLWFDLMFDLQARGGHGSALAAEVRDSIAAYYRRVTTTARPMNRLVAAAMVATIVGIVGEVAQTTGRSWAEWTSLALTVIAVGIATTRTVRHAVRLGTQYDPADRQTDLARSILRDHLVCVVAIGLVLGLQLVAV